MKKQFIVVVEFDVDDGCDFCDVDTLPDYIAGLFMENDREVKESREREQADGESLPPDYRYSNLDVYDGLENLHQAMQAGRALIRPTMVALQMEDDTPCEDRALCSICDQPRVRESLEEGVEDSGEEDVISDSWEDCTGTIGIECSECGYSTDPNVGVCDICQRGRRWLQNVPNGRRICQDCIDSAQI